MDDERILTSEAQARAVRDVGFLGHFMTPRSPSEVAKSLGMPANLAHHHAQRHVALGLLQEVERKGGRVLYQLTARTFRHAYGLLTTDGADEHTTTVMNRLKTSFLEAYARSARRAEGLEGEWVVFDFAPGKERPTGELAGKDEMAAEPRPAHLQTRTLNLSAEAYQAFVRRVARLLDEVEGEEPSGGTCTLAFLALDGPLQEGARDSRTVSSFVPLPVPDRPS